MKTVEVAETKVGVRVISPFVNKNADRSYFGFSIDLWNKISGSAKLPTTKFQEFENVGSLIDSVEKKNVDVGIAAISITSDRESRVDFSQPMFDAGLQIMVPGDVQPQSSGPKEFFSKIFNALWNEAFLYLVLSIALLGFILANIAYVLERMHPNGYSAKIILSELCKHFGGLCPPSHLKLITTQQLVKDELLLLLGCILV